MFSRDALWLQKLQKKIISLISIILQLIYINKWNKYLTLINCVVQNGMYFKNNRIF